MMMMMERIMMKRPMIQLPHLLFPVQILLHNNFFMSFDDCNEFKLARKNLQTFFKNQFQNDFLNIIAFIIVSDFSIIHYIHNIIMSNDKHDRINYLYQAALLVSKNTNQSSISREYINTMKKITTKCVLRV
jgi:hypothetical protein